MKIFHSATPAMKTFRIGNRRFKCDDVVLGIPINPELPENFSNTPNEERSGRSRAWWGVPFIEVYHDDHPQFIEHWKGNVRFDVRRLDGGAWDRPTCLGMFGTQLEAVRLARYLCPPVPSVRGNQPRTMI